MKKEIILKGLSRDLSNPEVEALKEFLDEFEELQKIITTIHSIKPSLGDEVLRDKAVNIANGLGDGSG